MTSLRITPAWDRTSHTAIDEIDATLCSLAIHIGDHNVTEHKAGNGKKVSSIHVPAYYLAEWLAENWWPLLYEPRKNEEEPDGRGFLSRHSMIDVRHGFALPELTIVSIGRPVRVATTRYRATFAGIEFLTSAFADAVRADVAGILRKFIGDCLEQLQRRNIIGTPMQEAWSLITGTQPDQVEFCELAGALGLCPYEIDLKISDAIDALVDTIGARAARDFCLASTEEHVLQSAEPLKEIIERMDSSPPITLEPLLKTKTLLPSDVFTAPSWRRGLNAAKNVMASLNVKDTDPLGADKLLDRLGIKTYSNRDPFDVDGGSSPAYAGLPLVGAISRQDAEARVALLPSDYASHRFAAFRAIYLGWVSEPTSRRLVTATVTRDQQASRQFAAEVLVPRKFLEAQASGNAGRLHTHQISEIAQSRKVSPWVVTHQATNAGIRVSSI
jgi:hypothetical protein